jgi:hypothetical protein
LKIYIVNGKACYSGNNTFTEIPPYELNMLIERGAIEETEVINYDN